MVSSAMHWPATVGAKPAKATRYPIMVVLSNIISMLLEEVDYGGSLPKEFFL
jgi:hypothetical protein